MACYTYSYTYSYLQLHKLLRLDSYNLSLDHCHYHYVRLGHSDCTCRSLQAHCFNSDARRQTVIVHCEWTIATAQNSGTITDRLYSFISNQLGTKLMGIVVIFFANCHFICWGKSSPSAIITTF